VLWCHTAAPRSFLLCLQDASSSVQALLGPRELMVIPSIKHPFSLCFQAKNRELLKQAAALSKGKKPEKSGAITSP